MNELSCVCFSFRAEVGWARVEGDQVRCIEARRTELKGTMTGDDGVRVAIICRGVSS